MRRRGFLASILALAAAPFAARAENLRFIQEQVTLFNGEWICRIEAAPPVLQYGDYLVFGHNTSPTMPPEARAALDARLHDLTRQIGKSDFKRPTEYLWLPTVPGDKERRVAYGAVKFWL